MSKVLPPGGGANAGSEAQGENMSTERAEFGVLMVDCAMRGCGADPGMKGDGSNGD